MSRIALDLKQFKHVKSDKDTTTLQHHDGHVLTIAKKALHPDNQKQLEAFCSGGMSPKKMADGGDTAKKTGNPNSQPASDPSQYDQTLSNGWQNIKNAFADGGETQSQPTTHEVASDMSMTPDWSKIKEGAKQTWQDAKDIYNNGLAQGGQVKRKMYADPTDVVTKDSDYTPEAVKNLPVVPKSAEPASQITPEQQALRDQYNQIVKTNNTAGNPNPQPGSPTSEKFPAYTDEQQLAPFQFDKSGRAPMNFDPNIVKQAQANVAQQQNANIANAQSAQLQAIQQNSAKVAMGAAPDTPVPDIPNVPVPLGSELNTPPPPPGTPPAPTAEDANLAGNIAQAKSNPDLTEDPYGLAQRSLSNQVGGQNALAKAIGAQGQAESVALQQTIKDKQDAQTDYKARYQELEDERQKHMQDIKDGYIDPNQYWTGDKNGNGGHSKIMAGIGMILAGFNPVAGQGNAAVNFLQRQMDMNLQAQAQNLGAKNNLLSANLHQFGNLKDAAMMTNIMQNDVMVQQLQKAAADAKTPIAAANAKIAIGQLQQTVAPMFQQLAMRRSMMNLANNGGGDPNAVNQMLGYMRVMNPEMAKEMEGRYVPGIGLGQVPVPEAARANIVAAKNVNDLFNRSLRIAQTPIPRNPADYAKFKAEADTVQQQLIGSIKQAQHDGVYKEAEADFLTKQIGDSPASLLRAYSSIPKVRELQQIKQQEYNNQLKTYGLPQQQLPQQAPPPQIKTVNGVKYQRGPNGEAIRVK